MKYIVKKEVEILGEVRVVGTVEAPNIIEIDEETAAPFVADGSLEVPNEVGTTLPPTQDLAHAPGVATTQANEPLPKEEEQPPAPAEEPKVDAPVEAAASADEAWTPELHEKQKGDGTGFVGKHTVGDMEVTPLAPQTTS